MSVSRFLDTNVIVYAYDTSDPIKQAKAQALLTDAMRQREPAQGVLDADFPKDGWAYKERILPVLNELQGGLAQFPAARQKPQQRVSVQQRLHGR